LGAGWPEIAGDVKLEKKTQISIVYSWRGLGKKKGMEEAGKEEAGSYTGCLVSEINNTTTRLQNVGGT
jgi:hypothetical protein